MMAALALLHGFTGSPESWRPVLEALGSDAVAIAPALAGHGRSEDPSAQQDGSFEAEVDRIAACLRASGKSPFHLCGYSLGGRIALGLLVRHQELFTRATVISAHPGLDAEPDRAERRAADERWCRILEDEGIEAFVEAWQKVPLFATQSRLPAQVLDAQRCQRLRCSPAGLCRSLRTAGLGRMPCYLPALPCIRIPVTVMAGALDLKFEALARRVVRELPNGRAVIVDGAGHNLLLERPEVVAEALRGT